MSTDIKGSGSRAADFFHGYAHDFNAIYGGDNGVLNRVINRLFLFMYTRTQMDTLFGKLAPGRHTTEPVGRDFFVTV
jgi:hypothetical protein